MPQPLRHHQPLAPADAGADHYHGGATPPVVIPTPTPTAVNGDVQRPRRLRRSRLHPATFPPGHQLFIANGCTVCHADDLSGGIGPALAGRTVEDLTEERIRQQLGEGGNGMPPFPDLS